MFIEKWKDTAFGSDYGGDFKDFLEEIPDKKLTLSIIYDRCDLKRYFDDPKLLREQTDNNVKIENKSFSHHVHYEDAVIALSAVVVESELAGVADLTKAYGSKKLVFDISKHELITLKNALSEIYDHPNNFILFDMLLSEETNHVKQDIAEIIDGLDECIANK
ncbi:imm68 putative immunity domain-containing protein [Hymenobacter sediminis]|uniref:imm68 putative immunity domain-containing protein n=1 Tax=Hymenobacter sediminis TaxID=2218621 RepID=UPI00138FCC25|nr:imm68 putative immunity domain-containing protein [Hymenobacter sediminis]